MTDYRSVLERAGSNAPSADLELERILQRRDRRRRNERILAGVVGVAVFLVAVWTVAPAVTGPAESGPAETPLLDAGWDGFGFPPEGLTPSTPVEGELITHYAKIHVGWVYVYADGRVLWFPGREADRDGPIYEQHLTPEGVDLVRSGDLDPALFLEGAHGSDPVPAGALADREIKPYVPAMYAICFSQQDFVPTLFTPSDGTAPIDIDTVDPSRVVDLLPAAARDLLVGKEHSYEPSAMWGDRRCSEVSTEDARHVAEILDDAGVGSVRDDRGELIGIGILTLLPHGMWQGWGY